MRRSPMPSRRKPLRTRTRLRRGGRLRPVSVKKRREQRERRKNLHDTYGTHPECQIRWDLGCTGWADDGHEPGMRSRGADPTDPDQVVPCCRHCHRAIHDDPLEAAARGWMIPSWEDEQ